jgi:hypothetical protein
MARNLWIQDSSNEDTEGSLRRMLKMPKGETIPFTFLERIDATTIGGVAKNPTKIGIDKIKVTRLVKQRAVKALTMKRITQKRFGKK